MQHSGSSEPCDPRSSIHSSTPLADHLLPGCSITDALCMVCFLATPSTAARRPLRNKVLHNALADTASLALLRFSGEADYYVYFLSLVMFLFFNMAGRPGLHPATFLMHGALHGAALAYSAECHGIRPASNTQNMQPETLHEVFGLHCSLTWTCIPRNVFLVCLTCSQLHSAECS